MYYTIYKITNNINGNYYIGMHKTKNLNDKYFGSGKILKQAILKNGKENFIKETLFIFDNEADMISKEKELVTRDLVEDKSCYNITIGGSGGAIWLGKSHSQETKDKLSKAHKGKVFSEEHKKNLSERAKNRKSSNRKGATHTEESKQKMKEARAKQIFSEETKQKFSGRSKKMWNNPELRSKIMESRKNNYEENFDNGTK